MTVALRPALARDDAFIRGLILGTIAEELGAAAWPEPMRSHLLEIQYTARRHAGSPESAGTECNIIQSGIIQYGDAAGETMDAGWLLMRTLPHEIRMIEIMVSPGSRGRGIGTGAVERVFAMADEARKPVRLHVNILNRGAVRLYERLGFRKIERDEVQYLMERSTRSRG
jgi:ribosomal protein S18 acetylase RimI-like enzyme